VKLHWKFYWSQYFGDWDWIPTLSVWHCPMPHYPKDLTLSWLRWGFTFRWWRQ
jgi:hypothetical protein